MLGKSLIPMVIKNRMYPGGIDEFPSNDEKNERQKYLLEFLPEELKELNKQSTLLHQQHPIALWFLGYVLSIVGIIITGLILINRHIFFDEIDGMTYRMKLTLSVLALISGFGILFSAKKEKLRINKQQDLIYVESKTILYRPRLEGRYIRYLEACSIVKKGRHTFHENTLRYCLRFSFSEGYEDLDVADTRLFMTMKKKYRQVCSVLDLPFPPMDQIKYTDESVVTLKWKLKKPVKKPEVFTHDPVAQQHQELTNRMIQQTNQVHSSLLINSESFSVQNTNTIKSKLIAKIKTLRKYRLNEDD